MSNTHGGKRLHAGRPRRTEKGGRSINIYLSLELLESIDALVASTGQSRSIIIADALLKHRPLKGAQRQ